MFLDFAAFTKGTEARREIQDKAHSAFEALKQTLSPVQTELLLNLEEAWQAESAAQLLNAFELTHLAV